MSTALLASVLAVGIFGVVASASSGMTPRQATLAACKKERGRFIPLPGIREVTPAGMSAFRPGWCTFVAYPAAIIVQVRATRTAPCRFRVRIEEAWPNELSARISTRRATCRSLRR